MSNKLRLVAENLASISFLEANGSSNAGDIASKLKSSTPKTQNSSEDDEILRQAYGPSMQPSASTFSTSQTNALSAMARNNSSSTTKK